MNWCSTCNEWHYSPESDRCPPIWLVWVRAEIERYTVMGEAVPSYHAHRIATSGDDA